MEAVDDRRLGRLGQGLTGVWSVVREVGRQMSRVTAGEAKQRSRCQANVVSHGPGAQQRLF